MLIAENLTKRYGHHIALNSLNLHVPKGEIFCLLGANGAGKSTTVNLFMGFIRQDEGKVLVGGAAPGDSMKEIAYIPENVMLYPTLSGLENLSYFSRLSGKKYSDDRLKEFLLEAGLPESAIRRPVKEYSKGMRQKVGIALTVAKEARVLFLDEPTSGLDPHASNEFSLLLKQLKQKGVTVLMVTHDLFRAKEVADKIGIMNEGKLLTILEAGQISHTGLEEIYLKLIAKKTEQR